MKMGEAFPSAFLKTDDLQGRQVTVTIESYSLEDVGDDEKKLVLHFAGKNRGLVCNKTNAASISDIYGDEMDEWLGKRITLYPTKTNYAGRMTPCIRIQEPAAPTAAPSPAHAGRAPAKRPAQPQLVEPPPESEADNIPF